MCENSSATLVCELIDRTRYENRAEAKRSVFRFIEAWYNQGDTTPPSIIYPR